MWMRMWMLAKPSGKPRIKICKGKGKRKGKGDRPGWGYRQGRWIGNRLDLDFPCIARQILPLPSSAILYTCTLYSLKHNRSSRRDATFGPATTANFKQEIPISR